ncbi:MAG: hypothetical protein AMXMBFR64_37610 [Myxococcales bacterium]
MPDPAPLRILLALALGLCACKDQALYDLDASDAGAVYDIAPPLDATVSILAPAPGGTFAAGGTVSFSIAVEGFTLVAPVDNPINERGRGHWRVSLDSAAGAELARGADTSFDVTLPADLSGEHELVVSLREKNGDHTGIEARVAAVVVGGVGGGSDAGGSDAAGSADTSDASGSGADAGP